LAQLVWLAGPIAIAMLALALPEETAAQHPWIRWFCGTVLNSFPFLAQPGAFGGRPKLAEFLTCLSFVMIPQSLAAAWWMESCKHSQLLWRFQRGRASLRPPWILVPLCAVILWVLVFALFVLPGYPSSRLMHAFVGAIGLMAISKIAVIPFSEWLVLRRARQSALRRRSAS
jgi:hypothetical protein